jgi:hypothetical protein
MAKLTNAEARKKLLFRVRLEAIRTAVADYMRSEGCSCCQNREKHENAGRRLAGLLGVPMHDDRSGYDFNRFSTEPIKGE